MTDKLPPHLLQLFQPRPPLRYLPPSDHAPEQRRSAPISGIAQFLAAKQEHDDDEAADAIAPVTSSAGESWFERKIKDRAAKRERAELLAKDPHREWQPDKDSNVRGDAYKTLFVSRLSYEVKNEDLEREFGRFGPIERIRIVKNELKKDNEEEKPLKGKQKRAIKRPHRGYAFIVFEREKDMKAAYKETDGIRIKDRKIVVDIERGRTVSGWRPRRLGGGLGGRGYTRTAPAKPFGFSGAPAGPGGGGFRSGGFRGGFDRGGFGGGKGGGGRFGDRGPGGYGGGGPRGGGVGYGGGGYGGGRPPPNAPAGPGMARSGGGYGDDRGYRGGGGRFNERGPSGGNREPIRERPGGGGYTDRDKPRDDRDRGYGGRDDFNRKRHQDSDNYDDPRQRRRY